MRNKQTNFVVMELVLERVDVGGDGTLYGQRVFGLAEPGEDAIERYVETGHRHWTAAAVCYRRIAIAAAAYRRPLNNTRTPADYDTRWRRINRTVQRPGK